MEKDSTAATVVGKGSLLGSLLDLVAAHRSAFRQERTYRRGVALVLSQPLLFGRHTMTQSLVALGQLEGDWSAWYRLLSVPRLDEQKLTRSLLRETLAHVGPTEPYRVVLDGIQIPRHSRKMVGTAWLKHPQTPAFRPGPHRAQRFVNLSWLTPAAAGYCRAIALRFEPAFPPKAVRPPGLAARKEWEAGLSALAWTRAELDAAGRSKQPLVAVADGSYSGAGLWSALPPSTTLLARCARNRALYALPEPVTGRGRPRKYGERAPTPADFLEERRGWHQITLDTRGRQIPLTYRVEGPFVVRKAAEQPLYLLVVKGIDHRLPGKTKRIRRAPTFCLVSASKGQAGWELPYSAPQLLAWAWQRWEVEVSHREMKSGLGVGEMQCWNPTSAVLSVQWQVWTYSLLVLAGYRTWGLTHCPLRPAGAWWQGAPRWSFSRLCQGFRAACWGDPNFRTVWLGTPTNWQKKEAWLAVYHNASHGALRA
jgi:hypothetical protein